jgi:hypothetical protein
VLAYASQYSLTWVFRAEACTTDCWTDLCIFFLLSSVQENSKELDVGVRPRSIRTGNDHTLLKHRHVSVLVHVSPVREGLQTSLAASGNDGQIYSTPTDYQYHRCLPVSAWTATPTNREGTLPCGHATYGGHLVLRRPWLFRWNLAYDDLLWEKNIIYLLKNNAEVVLNNRKDQGRRERWTTTSHMRKESTRIDRNGHDCSQLEQALGSPVRPSPTPLLKFTHKKKCTLCIPRIYDKSACMHMHKVDDYADTEFHE